jgi:Ni/Fe-hydrogenase subunit HybB-like protein
LEEIMPVFVVPAIIVGSGIVLLGGGYWILHAMH